MIYTVTLNPALDKTVAAAGFALNTVNRATAVRYDAGGKGLNVSRALSAMGAQSEAFCLLGGETGARLGRMCAEAGLRLRRFAAAGESRTNTKIVDPAAGLFTDLNEPGPAPAAGETERMLAELCTAVVPGDWVVLAGSLPGGLPASLYRDWTLALHNAGAQVLVDADGEALRLAAGAGPDFLKPNRQELSTLYGQPLASIPAVAEAAQALQNAGVGCVLVTLGGEGALLAAPEGLWYAGGCPVPVQSTVGAGDAAVAAALYQMQRGAPGPELLRFAVAFSAAAAATEGTCPPTMEAARALLPKVTVRACGPA